MSIPALTLWQPWATLVFAGGADGRGMKVHETRSWPAPPELVGERLVIHAGGRHPRPGDVPQELLRLIGQRFAGRDEPLPYGAAIGTVLLRRCARTEVTAPATSDDRIAGRWDAGRFAWELAEPIAFAVPRPMRGHQGIWYCPAELAEVR